MRLENIQAVLRPRLPDEAVDLGLAMTRRHWPAVMKGWLCFTLPLWLALGVALRNHPQWFFLIAWWLKPLYDRIPVFYLGRSLFGAPPSLKEQIRAWPRLMIQDAGRALLWGRLGPARALTLAATVLEGLPRRALRKRMEILKVWCGGAAGKLLGTAALLESAVALGFFMPGSEFLPGEWMEEFTGSFGDLTNLEIPAWLYWFTGGCWLAAVTLVEPFFAGAGFGLYLNTRAEMEGWDIELVFRRLKNRLEERAPKPEPPAVPPPSARVSALPLLLVPAVWLAAPLVPSARAQEVSGPDQVEYSRDDVAGVAGGGDEAERARAQIREVLAHPDFKNHTKIRKEWVPARSEKKEENKPGLEFSRGASVVGMLPEAVFWGGLFVLATWLAWLMWRHRGTFGFDGGHGVAPPEPPRVVMGLELNPEALPEDVPAAALSAWRAGERERALRLLYHGALTWLARRGGLPVRESDTEGDCLRHARNLPDAARRAYFETLTRVWTGAAYARIWPADREMERLCREWPFSWEERPSSADGASPLNTAAALAAGIFLCLSMSACKGRWEERTVETGYKGEARKNPWLAAGRFLSRENCVVEYRKTPGALPEPGNGVLCVHGPEVASAGTARRLLNWVRRGGHLIYFAAGGESYRNDWTGDPDGALVRDQPLLNELGVFPKENFVIFHVEGREEGHAETATKVMFLSGLELRAGFAGNPCLDVSKMEGFRADAEGEGFLLAGPPEKAALASLRLGFGRVTLLANAKPFRNRWIGEHDNALLLKRLVEMGGVDVPEVWFVQGGGPSFWAMLGAHGWRALVALGVLLALWLWRWMPRPGPAREPTGGRAHRRFARHLEETGMFFWRWRLTDSLLEPARRAVLQAARARGLPERGAEHTEALAARSGLPPERVEEALGGDPDAARDPRVFVRRVGDLQTLLKNI